MTQEEVQKAIQEHNTNTVQPTTQDPPQPVVLDDLAKMIPIFEMLRRPKYHVTTAPTFIPKSFLEQIQFYDDEGGTPVRRLYLYVNGGWHYVTLT